MCTYDYMEELREAARAGEELKDVFPIPTPLEIREKYGFGLMRCKKIAYQLQLRYNECTK